MEEFFAKHEAKLTQIGIDFKRAAQEAGLILLDDMTSPVEQRDEGLLTAVTRMFDTDDFYEEFKSWFARAKELGVTHVAFMTSDSVWMRNNATAEAVMRYKFRAATIPYFGATRSPDGVISYPLI